MGTNTATADNPSLTTRNWIGKNPIRIVFDRNLILPPDLNLFNRHAKTIIIADNTAKGMKINKFNENIGIVFVDYDNDFFTELFNILLEKDIQSIIIEGGEKVLNSFIENEYWDEARIFYGDKEFKNGIKAPKIEMQALFNETLGNSKLTFIKK